MSKKVMSVPEGTRDLLYTECKVIEKLVGNINKVFHQWGYDEVITPTLEFYDTFNNYPRGIRQEEMYKFFDNNGRILALRADGTIPIARLVSTKLRQCKLPLRLRYSSRVFRLNESLVGKKNEFIDCGIEFIGGDTFQSDVEVLIMGIEALRESGMDDFKIEVGHIGIFNSLWDELNISDEYRQALSELIEHKKLVELDELLNKVDLSDEYKNIFKNLPWLFGGEEALKKGKELISNVKVNKIIDYLQDIYEALKAVGHEQYITFDLGITPRIDYYSGIIFKGYVQGVGNYVLYGGRYDNLIKSYGSDLKAIGLSININGLSEAVDEECFLDKDEIRKVYYNDSNFISQLKKAEVKRAQGLRVELVREV